MKIKLAQAGKRFNRDWIFRGVDLEFESGTAYAITGPNGSGKSTLLQSIGGMLQLSEGHIHFEEAGTIAPEHTYRTVSFCAPYLDVIEEMTLTEFLTFHQQFKPLIPGVDQSSVIREIGLEAAADKQIRYYSSGMKQRVKLAQALFSDTAAVLLDEPCSNLDDKGITLYHSLIVKYGRSRIVIVCSNDKVEYSFARSVVSILDYKKQTV
ncbi:MAG TPA: ATP-binding cassette domain-containing protein [Flavisolibacter sp.]|jgi:ABC-type multidrug transport system ATPase subunit|nr:ATP-binding cassette domain-containing protein [Flavisolibacter sp.]